MRALVASAVSLAIVACSDDVGLPDARPTIDAAAPGQLALSWTLAHGGGPQTCASVGATGVSADIVLQGSAFGVVDAWSCASMMGTTRMLEPGRYDVRVSVTGGGTLDGPIVIRDLEVRPGQVTTVPPVAFDVEPSGTLTFRLTTQTTGNCDATPMGAGITATRIELRDSAGTCVPTTFMIGAGAMQPAGTYASDCGAATHACIAGDQDVTAMMVSAGQHSMVLTGLVGALPCWTRTTQFSVRAGGLTTTLNPQLLARSMTAGCPMP